MARSFCLIYATIGLITVSKTVPARFTFVIETIEDSNMMAELMAFRIGKGNVTNYFPPIFNKHTWYGIYFINAINDPVNAGEQQPFIVFLDANFDFITQQASNDQQGFLVLFHHNFLPPRLGDKLHQLPIFLQQGCGPFTLDWQQVPELNLLFDKICSELPSDYPYKKELLATLITQLIHFVIKNFKPCHGSF